MKDLVCLQFVDGSNWCTGNVIRSVMHTEFFVTGTRILQRFVDGGQRRVGWGGGGRRRAKAYTRRNDVGGAVVGEEWKGSD